MKPVNIYGWSCIKPLLMDEMAEWFKNPLLSYKAYVHRGVPKFPTINSEAKYVYEYIMWLRSNTNILDKVLEENETCFIIQFKNTTLFFSFNELVYTCNFVEVIP
jgi:hypothetical protein